MILFSVLALSFLAYIPTAEGTAKILVTKNFGHGWVVGNRINVVHYALHNIGDEAAIDVVLDDQRSFPSNKFSPAVGYFTVKFPRIEARSNVTHHVSFTPVVLTEHEDHDVVVYYTTESDNKIHSVKYPGSGKYLIYSEKLYEKFFGDRLEHFVLFAAISCSTTVVFILFYNRSSKRYSVDRKKHH